MESKKSRRQKIKKFIFTKFAEFCDFLAELQDFGQKITSLSNITPKKLLVYMILKVALSKSSQNGFLLFLSFEVVCHSIDWRMDNQVPISPTFYVKQIPKVQKRQPSCQSFYTFRICACKSSSQNIDEIDATCQYHQHFTWIFYLHMVNGVNFCS